MNLLIESTNMQEVVDRMKLGYRKGGRDFVVDMNGPASNRPPRQVVIAMAGTDTPSRQLFMQRLEEGGFPVERFDHMLHINSGLTHVFPDDEEFEAALGGLTI
ncbi:unnamed protein product, partial [marine sediment metagenome]